jgi:membrane associated rhomboid family serine protease
VLAAAVTHLVVNTWMGADPAPTVGASGGVYGVLLAYGLYFPNRQLMLLIPPVPMRARTLVILYAVLELVLGVTGTAAGVAHFAHLGGMLGGYIMIRYRRGFRN